MMSESLLIWWVIVSLKIFTPRSQIDRVSCMDAYVYVTHCIFYCVFQFWLLVFFSFLFPLLFLTSSFDPIPGWKLSSLFLFIKYKMRSHQINLWTFQFCSLLDCDGVRLKSKCYVKYWQCTNLTVISGRLFGVFFWCCCWLVHNHL